MGLGFAAEADTATSDLPCEVTFEVSAIGPEHRLPDVPPLQASVRISCGPVVELLLIDRAVARIVVNVASGLTVVPSPLTATMSKW